MNLESGPLTLALAMFIGVTSGGTDPMIFLTEVTAPFIFGSIIVLNMLQNSLFARMTQPLKGVMNTLAAAVIGLALAHLYLALLPMVMGALAEERTAISMSRSVR